MLPSVERLCGALPSAHTCEIALWGTAGAAIGRKSGDLLPGMDKWRRRKAEWGGFKVGTGLMVGGGRTCLLNGERRPGRAALSPSQWGAVPTFGR